MPAPVLTVHISTQPVRPIQGTLKISRSLNQRDTCDMTIFTTTSTISAYQTGQAVIVTDGGSNNLFAGRIDKVSEGIANDKAGINQSNQKWWALSCVSFDSILDRFYAMGSWTGQTAGRIIRELVANNLSAEVVIASSVEDGPIIPQFDVTTPTKLSDILNTLSQQTKFPWYVEYLSINSYNLNFFDPGVSSTVFSLTDGTLFESIDPISDLSMYRNVQKVITDNLNAQESFAGTASAPQTITLSQPATALVDVLIDGIAQMFGVLGTDTGKDWYYTPGSTSVVQSATGTAVPTTKNIVIRYTPLATQTFAGNGTTALTLTLTHGVQSVTSITVNGGTPEAVGQIGVDAAHTKDWYFSPNSPDIIRDTTSPTLVLGDSIVVTYQPVAGFVIAKSDSEITYRQTIEGGSGIHQSVDPAVSGSTIEDAYTLALSLLRRYGNSYPGSGRLDVREIDFGVTTAREPTATVMRPGARVAVNSTARGIVGNFLVSSDSISDLGGTTIKMDIRLTRDEFQDNWEPFYDQVASVSPAAITSANTTTIVTGGGPASAF